MKLPEIVVRVELKRYLTKFGETIAALLRRWRRRRNHRLSAVHFEQYQGRSRWRPFLLPRLLPKVGIICNLDSIAP